MKDLQPLNENVLLDVSTEETEEKTASGIIIPDTAKEKPQYGTVVAIGQIENPSVAVGDKVYYKKFSGSELEKGDKKYLIIPYDDLLAKVADTEKI
ncbi:MAG: co-chaperone GroES [Bacteroidota bacterium]